MDLRIGELGFSNPPAAPRRPAGTPAAFALPKQRDAGIPASPPPAVLREVEAAGRRAEELRRARRELHFEVDDESGRVIVQVRDLDGNVIRTIPPSEALDIMSGEGF